MSRGTLDKITSEEIFGQKFTALLDEWKKRTGKTQLDLRMRAGISQNNLTNYKKGQRPSDLIIESILEVINNDLGLDGNQKIDIWYFAPDTHAEKYSCSSAYMEEVIKAKEEKAEELGLDKRFLDFIAESTLFNETYTPWSPLVENYSIFAEPPYKRMDFGKTAEIKKKGFSFQIEKAGKTITLSDADLYVWKDIQDKVISYANYLIAQRSEEMQRQLDKANEMCKHDSGNGFIGYGTLSKEQLIECDPLMKWYIK